MTPQTLEQLLQRAQAIAGLTLGELADELHVAVPPDLKRNKGWVGMLLETALGATAGSKAEQDFAHLGVELKTLPINEQGFPLETTFVSLAPLAQNCGVQWEHSSHSFTRTSRRRANFMATERRARTPPKTGLGRIDGIHHAGTIDANYRTHRRSHAAKTERRQQSRDN